MLYRTEPNVQVLVHAQRPDGEAKGEIIMVHGLEGSSASGYMQSMAYAALERGYATHRFNMRGCGGSERLSLTSYHAGQTSDLLFVVSERKRLSRMPLFLAGYSLGGNVVLKLAGELGDGASELLAGVIAVSAPIELAAGVEALARRENRLYQARFVERLKDRIRRKHLHAPEVYTLEHLPKVRTVVDFDNYYTAPLFGFGTAANYFRTQSSNQFLENIRTPTLMVHAKDDPLVPFHIYDYPAISENSHLRLVAVDRGGHMGFLARRRPRFWLDELTMDWVEEISNKSAGAHVSY